jgi:hypothetical protein
MFSLVHFSLVFQSVNHIPLLVCPLPSFFVLISFFFLPKAPSPNLHSPNLQISSYIHYLPIFFDFRQLQKSRYIKTFRHKSSLHKMAYAFVVFLRIAQGIFAGIGLALAAYGMQSLGRHNYNLLTCRSPSLQPQSRSYRCAIQLREQLLDLRPDFRLGLSCLPRDLSPLFIQE